MAISDILSSLGGGKPKSKTVDFSGAYRDSTRGMTLKALQQRQRELQEASARAMAPRQIGHPLQGVAQIADVISSGIREGRAANQEAAGRARFAELLAGGLAPDEIGEAMGLDPETAMKYQERTWAQEDRKEERGYTEGRDLLKHGWDVDKQTAEVKARQEEAKAAEAAALKRQDDQQEATRILANDRATIEQKQAAQKVLDDAASAKQDAALKPEEAQINAAVEAGTMSQADADAKLEIIRRKDEADIANALPAQVTAVPPEIAAARGGDIAKNPQDYSYNTKTQEITPVERARSPQDMAATDKFEVGLVENRATQANLQKALELAPTIFEGSGVFGAGGAKQRADIILKTPGAYSPEMVKQATATQAYFNIMNKEAIMAMSNALTGATTEYEMQQFVKIMSDEATPLATKQAELARMQAKVKAHEQRLLRQVGESRGNVNAGAEQLTPPPAAAPPEDADARRAERKAKYGLEDD
jgi:hypothetical protein